MTWELFQQFARRREKPLKRLKVPSPSLHRAKATVLMSSPSLGCEISGPGIANLIHSHDSGVPSTPNFAIEEKAQKSKSAAVITELGIGNFKAFGALQRVPIKPLTLIFGANSSGKSSIIHSLLLVHHALAHGNVDVHEPRLAGQSVDLGGFLEFVHGHDLNKRCTLKFSLRHQPIETNSFSAFERAMLLLEVGRALYGESADGHFGPVGVSAFELKLDEKHLLRAERIKDNDLRVSSVNFEHPIFKSLFTRIERIRPPDSPDRQPAGPWGSSPEQQELQALHENFAKLREAAQAAGPAVPGKSENTWEEVQRLYDTTAVKLRGHHEVDSRIRADFAGELRAELRRRLNEVPLQPGNFMPVSVRPRGGLEHYIEAIESGEEFQEVWKGLEKLDNNDLFEELGRIFCFEMEILLDRINVELNRTLESVKYLGPLRCYPPRHLIGMHDQDPNWISGGGHAWDILRRDTEVVAKVNQWLGGVQGQNASYELRVRNLTDLKRVSDAEKKRLAARLRETGAKGEAGALTAVEALLAELANAPSSNAFAEIVLCDRRTGLEVSHRDVGVGISQLLPVLVHAYADQNQIVTIEQPEIHLHPALQAELGDVFIESALGERKNTFILETHSEHLILRMLRRVRETSEGKLAVGATPVRPEDLSVLYVEPTAQGSVVRQMPVTPDGDFAVPWPGGFFAERLADLP